MNLLDFNFLPMSFLCVHENVQEWKTPPPFGIEWDAVVFHVEDLEEVVVLATVAVGAQLGLGKIIFKNFD